MSSAKFASITSSLLARKGEALPWSHGMAEPEKLSLPWRQHVRRAAAASAAGQGKILFHPHVAA